VKRYPWLAIGHGVYAVPKGRWENVYVNFHASNFGELPFLSASLNTIGRIGLGDTMGWDTCLSSLVATSHWVTGGEGKGSWMSPLVDAGRGLLRFTISKIILGFAEITFQERRPLQL
jgi:hypothetical protein